VETLSLAPGLPEAIIEHARKGCPQEVCGLIAGRDGLGLHRYPALNVAAMPETRYEVDVNTLARQVEFEDAGLELVAIYHSHPCSPAVPSPADLAEARYPDAAYIICSLERPEAPVLRAFRIRGDDVWEVGLRQALDK
jgi:proteasome lid subunit RPN8/RPN11